MDALEENLKTLHKEQSRFAARARYLKQAMQRCQELKESAGHDVIADFYEGVLNRIAVFEHEADGLVGWLGDEFEKLEWGIAEADMLDDEGRSALRAYMQRDTDLSIKNMISSTEGYDELIRILKKVDGLEGHREGEVKEG
ncbi:MAG: hypothetical protein AB7U75_17310 [Hyphomicrobiaceae bacterium]